ncbi:YihY/virulence factor BrkB family protein [Nocardia sp. CDC160]|uniref:YihY/virulence factor BrkB family protein n=1 Tax=Nocardia sp. CDC160 TaxID=3112166 RepID=UPI002DB6A2BC|nr:YihY/virulence factor BrkB family protein [Nocardia sp. CDC160]MEC3914767.1 YihY/virulence factor BrkB family protein [Nocardia sp. CDC160]
MDGHDIGGPTDLSRRAWIGVARRVFGSIWSNRVTDWAAALTYYSVLSLFPGLVLLAALLGLLGRGATDALISTVQAAGSSNETGALVDALHQLQGARTYSGPVAIFGLITALWTASGYIGAFIRAANSLYDVGEGRAAWKTLPLRIGLTLAVVVVVAATAVGLVLSGDLAQRTGRWLGVGTTAVTVWNIAKWPVLLLLVSLVCALLYWAAPNVRQPGFRWITPGSAAAVLIWAAASAGFALYVAHFGSYNKVYGSLAGAVIFLIWLWLTNLAVLFGAAFDAELARARGLAQGQPPDQQPFLPPRDQPDDEPEQV